MTATRIAAAPSTSAPSPTRIAPPRSLWKAGTAAGLAAAMTTTAIAALARAVDVPVAAGPGQAIPLLGFAQLTLFFTAVGVLLARIVARRSVHPRTTVRNLTVALTALSCVPDLVLSTDTASRVVLVATHLAAAAIVIPALLSRLPERS
jgi:Family of unknown function (DUF6069)